MSTACTHLDRINITESDAEACPQCVASGDDWVQLRMCLTCGALGCCSDSVNSHAEEHHRQTGHPLIRSLAPGEDWRYCYLDGALVRAPMGATRE
ncbi:UBP-type zinc finger domain-containing protein [Micromonospora sp. NBC_01739]|nr:UBP-type zinc finger domain-containing protein [Micromonospora sp. NBC_01739]